MKNELDLSNYPNKSDFRNTTKVDTSGSVKNTDLTNLKSDVDKLHIDE